MSIQAKSLADGQLPSSKGTLYTCGTTSAFIRVIRTTSTIDSQTVVIYVKRNGSVSRALGQAFLNTAETEEWLDNALELSNGDVIEGYATNAAAVDYTITGAEQT